MEKSSQHPAAKPRPSGHKPQKITQYQVVEPVGLMDFLSRSLTGQSRTTVKSLLSHQQVMVNRQVIRQFDHKLEKGDVVEIHWDKGLSMLRHPHLRIVFEDRYLIVAEKDAGLLSIATEKERVKTAYSILHDYVRKKSPGNKIFVVHRLDRETSGLLLFAKTPEVQSLMQDNWRFAVNQRRYVAVLEGDLSKAEGGGKGTVTSYLRESKAYIVYSSPNPEDGVKAVTHYKLLKSKNDYSLVEFHLDTGRKNQIRVQMNSLGYPVAGDLKYGGHKTRMNRMALHACVLSFTHPMTGEAMQFESKIPEEFLKMVE